MAKTRSLALALLTGVALFMAAPVLAEVKLSSAEYPGKGKAVDALKPASDYSDVLKQRTRAAGIMRARAHGFVPSADLQGYAKGVLMRMLAGVTLPPSFQPDVRILASPEFSAVCTPDGTIVVTIGLLEQAESEDELAFVLAHEISHGIYRHHASDWFTRSQYYAVMNAGALEDSGALGAFSVGGVSGGDISRGISVAKNLYKLSANVLAPQFQQGQEDEADALGFDLVVKAGYSPEGASALLGRLQQVEEAAAREAQKAQSAKRSSSGSSGGGMGGLLGSLGGSITDIAIAGFNAGVDTFATETRAHRTAADRIELISQYQFREYRSLVPGAPKPLPWQGAKKGSLAALVAHYEAADAVADFASGSTAQSGRAQSPAQAAAAVGQAVGAPTNNHAYTQFAAAQYYQSSKKEAQAKAALATAVKSPEPSWIAYSALIDNDIKRSDYASAQTVMTDAVARFEDSPVLLPKRIEVLRGLGQQSEADRLVSQCDSYDIKELYAACKKAAGRS